MKNLYKFKKWKSFIIIFSLLSSILASFMAIYHFEKPNYNLYNKSNDEKLLEISETYYKFVPFIRDYVEENETVLFIDYYYYIYIRNFLVPEIKVIYFEYQGENNNSIFISFAKENYIDYMFKGVIEPPLFLTNTTLFPRIEYNHQIYLISINRSVLKWI